MANRAERVITCSSYMREHVADIYGLDEARVNVIPNGIDPSELVPVDDLDTLRGRFAAAGREARAAGRPARLREGLPARARGAARPDRAGREACASSWPGRARRSRSCASRPASSASTRTAPSSAGSATTCCTRSTGSPTSRSCRRSTSPSGWWRSRRWRPAAPAWWPTRAGCARWCRTRTWACASARATRARSATMAERLLTDERAARPARGRGLEHVLSFDWADVARQVGEVYAELVPASLRSG